MHLNHLFLLLIAVPSYGFILNLKPVQFLKCPSLRVLKRYPSDGSEFDIKVGPEHHLIEVDHKKLDQLGDRLVEVHEVKVDAVNVTAITFLSLAFILFVLANMTDSGVSGWLASLQNKHS